MDPSKKHGRRRQRERRRDGSAAKQVNPLKWQHGNKLARLEANWFARAFGERAHMPLVVDLGTGAGEWVLEAARCFEELNFLGLDVREEALPSDETPRNAAFVAANSSEGDVDALLREARRFCKIRYVFAQYPDPHWKKKHRRRAMLTPSLCRAIALSIPGAFVVRTDVEHVATDVEHAAFQAPALLETVEPTPDLVRLLAIPTERELYARRRDPDFRPHVRLFRPTNALPPLDARFGDAARRSRKAGRKAGCLP